MTRDLANILRSGVEQSNSPFRPFAVGPVELSQGKRHRAIECRIED
ncbi:hypothetical protein M3J09_011511 [Ascochyta lentis]